MIEPDVKRATAFFDGQNLFYAAKEAFGYSYPNYDPIALANNICSANSWELKRIHFYTGIPAPAADLVWHNFWKSKLSVLGTRDVTVFSRPLRYRNQTIATPTGAKTTALIGQEKGIDVRIAIDIIRLALDMQYDVALIFSQDQDFSEVASEIRKIAQTQQRWIKIASAFPFSPTSRNTRGIDKTDWIRIDRATYDACLDKNDYRLKEESAL